jgi:hypothetical protein
MQRTAGNMAVGAMILQRAGKAAAPATPYSVTMDPLGMLPVMQWSSVAAAGNRAERQKREVRPLVTLTLPVSQETQKLFAAAQSYMHFEQALISATAGPTVSLTDVFIGSLSVSKAPNELITVQLDGESIEVTG